MANIKVKLADNSVFNIPVVAGSEYVIGEFELEGTDPYKSNKSKTCIKVTDVDGNIVYNTINRLEYSNSDTYSRGIENAFNVGGFKQPGRTLSGTEKDLALQLKLQDNLDKLVSSILLDGEARFYSEAMPWTSGNDAKNIKTEIAEFQVAKDQWLRTNAERISTAESRGDSEFRLSTGGILSVDTNISEIAAFSCGDFKIKDPLQGPFKYMDVFANASN